MQPCTLEWRLNALAHASNTHAINNDFELHAARSLPPLIHAVEQNFEIATMLQTGPSSYKLEYQIRKESPLAPLNPNACTRFFLQMASTGQMSSDRSKLSYKRATNNLLLQRKPKEEQDRRRQVFLKKVRQVTDDKKWEFRSEEVRGNHDWDSSITHLGWYGIRYWERIS